MFIQDHVPGPNLTRFLHAGLAGGPLGGAAGPGRPGSSASASLPYGVSASMMAAQDPFSALSQTGGGDTKLLQQCEFCS